MERTTSNSSFRQPPTSGSGAGEGHASIPSALGMTKSIQARLLRREAGDELATIGRGARIWDACQTSLQDLFGRYDPTFQEHGRLRFQLLKSGEVRVLGKNGEEVRGLSPDLLEQTYSVLCMLSEWRGDPRAELEGCRDGPNSYPFSAPSKRAGWDDSDLRYRLDEHHDRISELERYLHERDARLEQLQSRNDESLARLERKLQKAQQRGEKVERLSRDLDHARAEAEQLRRERNELESGFGVYRQLQSALMEEATDKLLEAQAELESLRQQLADREVIDPAVQRVTELEGEVSRLREKHQSELASARNRLAEEVSRSEQRAASLHLQQGATNELQRELDVAKSKLERAESDYQKSLEETESRLRQEAAQAQGSARELQSKIDQLEQQLKSVAEASETKVHEERGRADEALSRLEELESEVGRLREGSEQGKTLAAALEEQRSVAEKATARVVEAEQQLAADRKKYSEELAQSRNREARTVHSLEEKLAGLAGDNKELLSQLSRARSALTEAEAKHEEALVKIQLDTDRRVKDAEKLLRGELDSMRAELQNEAILAREEHGRLLDEAEQRVKGALQRETEAGRRVIELTEEQARISQELKEAQSRLGEADIDRETVQARIGELEKQQLELQSALQNSERLYAAGQQEVSELATHLEEAVEKRDRFERELEVVNLRADRAEDQVKQLQGELEEQGGTLAARESRLLEIESALKEAKEQLSTDQAELQALEASRKQALAAVKSKGDQVGRTERDLAIANQRVSSLNDEVSALRVRFEAAEAKTKDAEALRAELSRKTEELERVSVNTERMEGRLRALESAGRGHEAELAKLREQLEIAQKRERSLLQMHVKKIVQEETGRVGKVPHRSQQIAKAVALRLAPDAGSAALEGNLGPVITASERLEKAQGTPAESQAEKKLNEAVRVVVLQLQSFKIKKSVRKPG